MTFCWRCLECGWQDETKSRQTPIHNCAGGATVVRDYRAEATGVQVFTSALGDGKVEQRRVNP